MVWKLAFRRSVAADMVGERKVDFRWGGRKA